jgi:dihydropteroate synthase
MRVIAEIVNAPTLQLESVRSRARYYEAEGADIIDIGMLAGKSNPGAVGELVEAVQSSVGIPVSIDTLEALTRWTRRRSRPRSTPGLT